MDERPQRQRVRKRWIHWFLPSGINEELGCSDSTSHVIYTYITYKYLFCIFSSSFRRKATAHSNFAKTFLRLGHPIFGRFNSFSQNHSLKSFGRNCETMSPCSARSVRSVTQFANSKIYFNAVADEFLSPAAAVCYVHSGQRTSDRPILYRSLGWMFYWCHSFIFNTARALRQVPSARQCTKCGRTNYIVPMMVVMNDLWVH